MAIEDSALQMAALARRVRVERQRSGRSLSAFARMANLPKSTVFSVEAGESNVTLTTLVALADAFGLDACDLLCEDDRHQLKGASDAIRAELYAQADEFEHPDSYRKGVADALAHR